jgi:hypothetical protein
VTSLPNDTVLTVRAGCGVPRRPPLAFGGLEWPADQGVGRRSADQPGDEAADRLDDTAGCRAEGERRRERDDLDPELELWVRIALRRAAAADGVVLHAEVLALGSGLRAELVGGVRDEADDVAPAVLLDKGASV